MASLKLNGDTSGTVTLTVPAVAGTNTLTLPAVTDTLVGLAATQTLTGKTLTSPTITGAVVSSMGSSVLTPATAQASTSGTSIDFTGIPSWVKRITVMFDGVSLSGTSSFLAQIGDSGGIEITGYNGGGSRSGVSSIAGATFTAGFGFNNSTAACLFSGNIIFCNITGNTWSASGLLGGSATEFSNITSGSKTLSGTLDRVRITTVNGTDTFDAGTINILYE
jgi:hypothetical protein